MPPDRIEAADLGDGAMPTLDAAVWSAVPAIPLVDARSGARPALATAVRFVVGDGFLAARFDCEATDVVVSMSRYKDKVWQEGAVEVYLQPASGAPLYEFQVSPIGTARDLRVLQPGEEAQSFDDAWSCPGLFAAATIHRDADRNVCGWSAVLGIPFTPIVDDARVGDDPDGWRISALRLEYRPREMSALRWHPTGDPHSRVFLCEIGRSGPPPGNPVVRPLANDARPV